MTRINLVDPKELMDQHLTTEFLELPRVPVQLHRSLKKRGIAGVLEMIPEKFTLGKGHVSFFYDKGIYLMQRYESLAKELTRRGFPCERLVNFDSMGSYIKHPQLLNDYEPTEEALAIIRARIAHRIACNPDWYLYEKRKPNQ